METQLNEDLKIAIDKHLSKEVGTRLQERFTELERKEIELKNTSEDLRLLRVSFSKLEEDIKKKERIETLISESDRKIADIEKRERDLELEKLKIKLEESEKRAEMVKEFTSGLVRNTSFRKTIFDSENQQPYTDSNGVYHYPMATSKHHEENNIIE